MTNGNLVIKDEVRRNADEAAMDCFRLFLYIPEMYEENHAKYQYVSFHSCSRTEC